MWDTNYKGVWHLKEEQSGTGNADLYQDSTSNNNDGDDQISATGLTGRINGGHQLDGTDDYIDMGDPASLDVQIGDMTISGWSSQTNDGAAAILAGKDQCGDNNMFHIVTSSSPNSAKFRVINDAATSFTISDPNGLAVNTWYYVVGVKSGSNIYFYTNGTAYGSTAISGTFLANTYSFNIGRRSQATCEQYMTGNVDEVRVSGVARSAAWIKTEYTNQSSPSTFYGMGGTEARSPSSPGLRFK